MQFALRDASTVDGSEWKNLISLFKGADGNVSTFWAVQEEDKKVAGIAVSWKSLDNQAAFFKKIELSKAIKAVTSKSIYNDMVIFLVDPAPTLSAPAVELVSWIYLVSKIDKEREDKVAYGFLKFADAISSRAPEAAGGLVSGWGQMPFEHEDVESRRFTSFIGWKSVEDHYKCKETPPFLENIHWLMENDDSGIEMVHYKYVDSA
ncbi:uncharacterized protein LY89DRAFT_737122 [Mollisia scopiformis]|uniref:ABM domain-containing protein n=1 Tax=Mollisia scopiformis TaxID=149040 RepID=A0A194WYU6_MOLSC|nr:uncharacterized protein LY89DRAFT_737122 [Mollisia scopiformis]KUJ13138.1 hypothetical protein LY89DRAFT_737122 [Mollisia scopiformis]